MFGRHFSTPAGQLIEEVTSTNSNSRFEDVVNTIGSYSEGPKDALRAFRKRLYGNKNLQQVSAAVSLLEYCVCHLGTHFHILVADRDFSGEVLVRLLNPKTQPLPAVEKKVLYIIKLLAETYPNHPMMTEITLLYHELVSKGYEFPGGKSSKTKRQGSSSASSSSSSRIVPPTQAIFLKDEQMKKLRADIAVVEGNIKVFSEILTTVKPDGDARDLQLMSELNRTCHAMQQRVVELIGQVLNEEITIVLLRVNDDLNNVFLRYERFESYKQTPIATPTPSRDPPPSYSEPEHHVTNDLIDLGFDPAPSTSNDVPQQTKLLSSPLAPSPSMAPKSNALSEDQVVSPQVDLQSTTTASGTKSLLSDDFGTLTLTNNPDDEEVKEIEQWLASDEQFGQQQQDDFNVFLSQRAASSQSTSNKPTLL